jgi:hypothetical protein
MYAMKDVGLLVREGATRGSRWIVKIRRIKETAFRVGAKA